MKPSDRRDLFSTPVSYRPAQRAALLVFTVCYLVTIAPPLYFLFKNYKMLDDIGYKFFPSLLDINNQDRLFILLFALGSYAIGAFIILAWQKEFIRKFTKPINHLQSHMSKTIQGHFGQPSLVSTHENHAAELIKTYNYLYSSIQSNLKRDVIFLEELEKVHAPELARVLINEKLGQLTERSEIKPLTQKKKVSKPEYKVAN
ncbi:MAG: hypothetical protein M9899_08095 [Bdellovibrionaceae bacterium]|nr:hypothetical protein [Pseudobdellovibrionaceae bacterium]